MKKTILVTLALAVVLSVTAQSTLQLKPEKNKIYRLKSISDQSISQTVNGMEQNTVSKSTTYLSFKALEITPEFVVAEVRFDSIISKSNAMGKNILISSANEGNMASEEASDVMSAIMNRLSKNPLFVKMDFSGKVQEILNYNMISQIVLKDTALIKGMAAPALKQQVSNTASMDAIKLMIENFTYNLPNKEVSEGGTWEFSAPINSGGMELEVKSSYKLNEIAGNDAMVESESSIKPAPNAKPMQYSGASISYDNLSGLGKADLVIDIETGFLKTANSRMHITGDLSVSVQGMNMTIPMIIDSQNTITIL